MLYSNVRALPQQYLVYSRTRECCIKYSAGHYRRLTIVLLNVSHSCTRPSCTCNIVTNLHAAQWQFCDYQPPLQCSFSSQLTTRHRASTSMYSLTFCVRFLLPERHQSKPAVQAAAVMLRTHPVDGQSPASQPRPLPMYGAQF